MPGSPGLTRRQVAVLATVTLASFIVVLDAAVVFIPLPAILRDLEGTLDQGAWVLGAFVLVFAIFLLPAIRLAARYDRRALFVVGMVVFAAASVGCALAPSMPVLLGARAVQGLGAAFTEAAVFTLIKAVLPEQERDRAFGVQTGAVGLGAVLGPILGGVVTTGLSWHFVFWLNVLVGVAVVGAALVVLPSSRDGAAVSLDSLGVLLGGSGLFLVTFGVIEGQPFGWGSAIVVGSLAGGVILLGAWVWWQRRAPEPLVDLRLFSFRRFAIGNVLRGACEFASLGLFFAVSHVLQTELGFSALAAGALLMAVIVGAVVGSPVAEALVGRLDLRWIVAAGFVLLAGGIFWVGHVTPETSWGFFLVPLGLAGIGFGLMESTVTEATRTALPDGRATNGWGVSYTSYLLGIAFGIAAVAAVWQSETATAVRESVSEAGLGSLGEDTITVYLAQGGAHPGEQGEILSSAVSTAVNAALLPCVVACLAAAVVAIFFTPGRAQPR